MGHQRVGKRNRKKLGSGSFFLLLVKCQQGDVRHFDHFEPDTRNVSHCVTLPSESGDQDLVILLNVVEAAVVRDEGGDLLSCFRDTAETWSADCKNDT